MSSVVSGLAAGAAAGLVATAPMTAAMGLMHELLPWWQRYPLPPRWIVERAIAAIGLRTRLTSKDRHRSTAVAHFAYGAGCGAVYGALATLVGSGPIRGMLFGLIVWAVSYVGWLPLVGLFPIATRQPRERNWLMIGAHLVWGAALAGQVSALRRSNR